eukprot:3044727-Prymnesium_polylepis.1
MWVVPLAKLQQDRKRARGGLCLDRAGQRGLRRCRSHRKHLRHRRDELHRRRLRRVGASVGGRSLGRSLGRGRGGRSHSARRRRGSRRPLRLRREHGGRCGVVRRRHGGSEDLAPAHGICARERRQGLGLRSARGCGGAAGRQL